jgi:2-iminoacetate synthase
VIESREYQEIYQTALELTTNAENIGLELAEVEAILSSRTSSGLSPQDVARLLNGLRSKDFPDIARKVEAKSQILRRSFYGSKYSTMAPVEIGSFRSSNCKFCGWRSSNKDMIRLRLKTESLVEEALGLFESGVTHIELSGGDDLPWLKSTLFHAASSVGSALKNSYDRSRLSVCLTPLTQGHYRRLKQEGQVDAILNWQESYSRDVYNKYVLSGQKRFSITEDFALDKSGDGWQFRIESQERAIQEGLQVGIGAMLGLNPKIEAEVLSVILHGRLLIDHYGPLPWPFIIGMPVWNPITTPTKDLRQPFWLNLQESFAFISAVYLLGFPDFAAWVFPNCRVSPKVQERSLEIAGCFTSTEVRLAPGAYKINQSSSDWTEHFDKVAGVPKNFSPAELLKGEQFSHSYMIHEKYLDLFRAHGLQKTDDFGLLPTTQELSSKQERAHRGDHLFS